MEQMMGVFGVVLQCWDDSFKTRRNDILSIIRERGGLADIPDVISRTPSSYELFSLFCRFLVLALEHTEQIDTEEEWTVYVDGSTHRFTFLPKATAQVAVEERVINGDLVAFTLEGRKITTNKEN